MKKKLDLEKKNMDEFYRVEYNQKIEQEKKLLEKSKSELARLKSLKNVK